MISDPETGRPQMPVEPTEPATAGDGTSPKQREGYDINGNREASKFRHQLREVQAERDALVTRLEQLQREQVNVIAARTITQPAALWEAGALLADLLGEDGQVDEERVTAAVVDAAQRLGLARPQALPKPDRSQGARGAVDLDSNSWSSLLGRPVG